MSSTVAEASAQDTSASAPSAGPSRVEAVDLVRGLAIVIMALDHTREFFTELPFQPENLAQSFPALFFTRWVTHLCAPAFFLLAGTGAFFYGLSRPVAQLSRFLWTRGAWLILLELTVIDYAFTFSWRFQVGIVIWTLGWSMIVLAILVRLRPIVIGTFAAMLILLHNLFDAFRPVGDSFAAVLAGFLHEPFIRVLPGGRVVGMLYPLVPWVGVMAAGLLLGRVYQLDRATRRRFLVAAGAAVTLAFVALRALNGYGDPRPWTPQPTALMTVCSFLNATKYPPSLAFLLMTLGPCLLLLGLFDGTPSRWARPLLVFGRVPLFFFIAHLYLLHVLAVGVAWAFGQPVAWLLDGAMLVDRPPGYGHGLPFVYGAWFAVILLLLPACRWYAELKRRHPGGVLSYL
jgi:uncharacterized membrane protein